MSVETTSFDPFDAPVEEPPADMVPEDAFDEFDDLLEGLELDEEESGEAVRVRDQVKTYTNPLDVGLKDKQWVPIRILTSEVKDKHIPRLSSKTCIAKQVGEGGKVKVYALFEQVEAALRNGAEEVVGDVPLPYFVATANHASERYGQRRFDWEIEVPVFTIKTALFKPQKNRTGYMNENGRSLRMATGATEAGTRVTRDNMHDVAERMVETVVMAQISISTSKNPKYRDLLDPDGNAINVLIDAETGGAVTLFKPEDGSGYVVVNSGEVWEGNENLLVEVEPQHYAIRDNGESSGPLKEKYFPVNDYINAPFLPVPERKVQVELGTGEIAEGEITWDTIGAVARGNHPGANVDILVTSKGELTGKTITAVWLGTQWNQVGGDGEGMEQFKGSGVESL